MGGGTVSELLEPQSNVDRHWRLPQGDGRRSLATSIALVAFIVLLGVTLLKAYVPFTRYAPGPTYDVLGKNDGKPIVQVEGHETYPTKGQLRMVTVNTTGPETQMSLFEAMTSWLHRDQDLYPKSAIYPKPISNDENRDESAREMVTSQDLAVAAALTELGYSPTTYPSVVQVIKDSPADGVLQAHDVIRTVNTVEVKTLDALLAELDKVKPGDKVELGIERDRSDSTVTITTKPDPTDPTRAVIGIYPAMGYVFPFDVNVDVAEGIGGPSAGAIFSLAIYDSLTPGALTGGRKIAGTGTMSADGKVGPISGVRQKIAGAERDGASLFLVPVDNCDEAVKAQTDLRVVPVATLHDAIDVVEKYAADTHADLPACKAATSEP